MKLALALLCGISLYLRTSTLAAVFPGGFINLVETDPWYHLRSIDNLVRNFPWRMQMDPYSSFRYSHELATGPFFDYVIAAIAWIIGLGHPPEHLVHLMAAWYPAVLGVLIVPAVFLLASEVFGRRAGLIAAAVAATLPGTFLRVGMVGYTDHHVMESLVSTVFFWLMLRAVGKQDRRAIAPGIALGAYLLTFVGGAFLVAIVIAWVLYEQIRSMWPRKIPAPPIQPILWSFCIALAIAAPWYRTLWMGYSIAALACGAVAIAAVGWLRCRSRAIFFGTLIGGAAAALAAVAIVAPSLFRILYRLAPSFSGKTGGIAELQSLVYRNGSFSLLPVWYEFGGAIALALAALVILAELAVRDPKPKRDFVLLWSAATLVFSAGQVRMAYYSAIGVAVLSGFVLDRLLERSWQIRSAAAVGALALVFAPNWLHAMSTTPGESPSEDWREALTWLRSNTPDPFPDPDFYYARYALPDPRASYSVMAWWDYGYWITGIGRRVPVTNPTQRDASSAAAFFLAQNEPEAAAILETWRSRYVMVDYRLPFLGDDDLTVGKLPSLFLYGADFSRDDYFLIVQERDANGGLKNRVLYRPEYFQSMLVRLFLFGGNAVDRPEGAAVARIRDDGTRRELVDLREFPTEEQARAAEQKCSYQGCLLVSASPLISCVHLNALTRFRPVFSSSSKVLHTGKNPDRSAVQIYEFH